MTLTGITCLRNEEHMLPFFLRHYLPMVDKLIVYENDSTDRTHEILSACPKVELRSFGHTDGINDRLHIESMRAAFQEIKEGWIVIMDGDEFVCVDKPLLEQADWTGADAIPSLGIDLFAEQFPVDDGKSQIYDLVTQGALIPLNSELMPAGGKTCLFKAGTPPLFGVGRHKEHTGRNLANFKVPFFHAYWLGWDRVLAKIRGRKLSPENIKKRWGVNHKDEVFMRAEYDSVAENSQDWLDFLRT